MTVTTNATIAVSAIRGAERERRQPASAWANAAPAAMYARTRAHRERAVQSFALRERSARDAATPRTRGTPAARCRPSRTASATSVAPTPTIHASSASSASSRHRDDPAQQSLLAPPHAGGFARRRPPDDRSRARGACRVRPAGRLFAHAAAGGRARSRARRPCRCRCRRSPDQIAVARVNANEMTSVGPR